MVTRVPERSAIVCVHTPGGARLYQIEEVFVDGRVLVLTACPDRLRDFSPHGRLSWLQRFLARWSI